jgi:CBS domain-containing membrane protein
LSRFKNFAAKFLAAPIQIDAKERWRALLGVGVGILFTGFLSRWLLAPGLAQTWLIAPIGASAVLVFAVPSSPLAQPWSVVGGNTVSALAGICCVIFIPDQLMAASIAVGLAVGLMFALRCLHPPGGATALLAVLVHATSFQFAAFPVLVNSVALVLFGVLYNSLTGRPYPHAQRSPSAAAMTSSRFSAADLDAALLHYNQVTDMPRDDLAALLHRAELSAFQRNLGSLRCTDIMSRDPVAVQFGTTLDEAWALMQRLHIKALPVIDRAHRIAGIVTVADFLRQVNLAQREGIGERLNAFIRRSGETHSEKPEVVGQIMTRQVRVASAQRYAIELVPLFSEGRHHHIPIIDENKRLVGIITQTDLVRALYRAVKPDI